ncbi:hypothetical protein INP51_14930 [Blautia liquoris]|jgi:glucose-1-phosphate thymidylyltransferase|uniref:Glucose-1-phosphate thymidylyltransferase n=1 Tax=Blautia liquoris TaxID=2779518 RepID=A0A7M2RGQ1_9FIRM|nr:sugar phosphate nucleotidyltransferase [Blautia liquoris]QOV19221.1 hypothetical protein INP51_14930 [Blautia liquoris]
MQEVVGFIPAAGVGSRMSGFPIMKEMLPMPASVSKDEKTSILIDNAIRSMIDNGITTIVFVVNDEKRELINYINREYVYPQKIQAAFIYQRIDGKHYGVPFAIESAYNFLKGKTVVMRFPDTLLLADVNLEGLLKCHESNNSDLTLGIFQTAYPERLGPVHMDKAGMISKLEDKPKGPTVYNTWNCIVWGDKFTDEVVHCINEKKSQGNEKEMIIAEIMQKFIAQKRAYAYEFENVVCIDVSSIKELEKIWENKN